MKEAYIKRDRIIYEIDVHDFRSHQLLEMMKMVNSESGLSFHCDRWNVSAPE